MIINQLNANFSQSNIQIFSALPRLKNENLWCNVFANICYQNSAYQFNSLNYTYEYSFDKNSNFVEHSFILLIDNIASILVPIFQKNNKLIIFEPGLNSQIEIKTFKLFLDLFLKQIALFCVKENIYKIEFLKSTFKLEEFSSLSNWELAIVKFGAKEVLDQYYVINLKDTDSEIKRSFRKSYRNLINKSYRLWNFEVGDHNNPNFDNFKAFKKLHLSEAGRETRPDTTWNEQEKKLQNGSGLTVSVKDRVSNELVGAAFFNITKDEAIYASAAYKRDLFPMPIGHGVQGTIISYLKKNKIQFYILGEKANDCNEISKKEKQIEYFKSGFTKNILGKTRHVWIK